MLYVDIPTFNEIRVLAEQRAKACVSLYIPTMAQTQNVEIARTTLKNLARTALGQLEAGGIDKRRRDAIAAHFDDIHDDDEFWKFQSNSLAILAMPD